MHVRTSAVGTVALVVIALSLLGGCGEDAATTVPPAAETTLRDERPAKPASPAPRGDRALAASAVLRRADLSSGWGDSKASVPDLRCSSRPFRSALAKVDSRLLELEQTSVQETVAVYRTPAEGRRAFGRLNSDPSIECLRRRARARMSKQTEGPPTRPEIARAESVGRWGAAMRFTSEGPSQVGTVRGIIDAVHVRVGRGVGALLIASGPSAPAGEVYEEVVAAFRERLDDAFG